MAGSRSRPAIRYITILAAPHPSDVSGTVVISLDAELGWGYRDRSPFPTERIERARSEWRRLIDLFDRFEIPATWAVVGHLLCEREDGFQTDHPTLTEWPPEGRKTDGDSDANPFSRPELWFADGLVEAIRDADVGHEIGSHSFSHVEFDEVSREIAYAELSAAAEVAADLDLPFDSFVFPRNGIAHRDVLAEWGLHCYRGRSPIADGSTLTRPIRNVLSGTRLGNTPLLVEPTIDEYGLVNIPASLFCFSFEGLARRMCAPLIGDPVVRKARRGIDQAAASDAGDEEIFHLWLHPNDVQADYAVDRIEAILKYLTECCQETDLSVETMGQVARRHRFGAAHPRANPPGR